MKKVIYIYEVKKGTYNIYTKHDSTNNQLVLTHTGTVTRNSITYVSITGKNNIIIDMDRVTGNNIMYIDIDRLGSYGVYEYIQKIVFSL